MKILITGWYGTETHGDKAILSGIINLLKRNISAVNISIHSSNPFYTKQTLHEIGHENIDILDSKNLNNKKKLSKYDYIFFGGGPIMDVINILEIFKILKFSKKNNSKFVLFGIGYGPFKRPLIKYFSDLIIKGSHFVITRDSKTYSSIKNLNKNTINIGDPAILHFLIGKEKVVQSSKESVSTRKDIVRPDGRKVRFVKINSNLNKNDNSIQDKKIISFSLRELPMVYSLLGKKEHEKVVNNFSSEISSLVNLLDNKQYQINFITMNTFFAGEDDRDFIAKIKNLIKNENIIFNFKINSLHEVISEIKKSHIFIGMRYHSVLFSTALNIPTIGIDYTFGGGKVSNYLNDLSYNSYVNFDKFDNKLIIEKINHIEENYDNNRKNLQKQFTTLGANTLMNFEKFISDQIT